MCSDEVLHLFGRLLAGMRPWSPGAVRRANPWAPGAVRRALVHSDAFCWVVVVRPARGESVSPEWGEISLHVWEGLGPQSGGRGTLRYRVLI